MKYVFPVRIAAATLALSGTAIALAATPPNSKDLTQGKWELVLDKSSFCGDAPQKSAREITESGWGLITAHATGVNAKGKPTDTWYVWRYDGNKYPADVDRVANEYITWKLVNPNKVEFTHYSKDDKVTQELARTVSSDGQTMTQTTRFVGKLKDGKPCMDSQVFQRK